MQPREYLRPIVRGWWFVVLAVVVAVVAVVAVSKASSSVNAAAPNGYRATATLVVNNTPAGRTVGQQLTALTLSTPTGEVPKRVAAKIGYQGDPQALASTITVANDPSTGTLTITVPQDAKATHAELVANTFATELIAYLNQQDTAQAKSDLDATVKLVGTLSGQVQQLDQKVTAERKNNTSSAVDEATLTAQSRALESATERQNTLSTSGPPPPQLQLLSPAVATPVSSTSSFLAPRSRLARAALAGLAALILSILVLFVVDRLSSKIRSRAAAEMAFGLPVLAEVPPVARRLQRRRRPAPIPLDQSTIAEAYRVLRSGLVMTRSVSRLTPVTAGSELADGPRSPDDSLEAIELEDGLRVIQVVSANAVEGRTSAVVALAASYAELGMSVLVVDGDLRHPRVAGAFGGDPSPGLSDLLLGSDPLSVEDVIRPTAYPNVSFLPAGTVVDSPAELMPAVRSLLVHARSLADIVLVDSPPLLLTSDSAELLAAVDAVVVVCRVGRTTADAAHRTNDLLARLAVPAAGLAMLGVPNAPVTRRSVRGRRAGRPGGPRLRVGADSARDADERLHTLLSGRSPGSPTADHGVAQFPANRAANGGTARSNGGVAADHRAAGADSGLRDPNAGSPPGVAGAPPGGDPTAR